MAGSVLSRCIILAPKTRFHFPFSFSNRNPISSSPFPLIQRFLSSSSDQPTAKKNINTKVDFSLSSDSEQDDEDYGTTKTIEKTNLPPPYDPFNKKPAIEEPEDPKNLQEIFHKMRTEGLVTNAVKMFDALSKDGLIHEASELFSQINDKGHMPDVVAHTTVVEAYMNAGRSKEGVKVFLRMLACGVAPNANTYSVLIKGLAGDARLNDAKKYLMEMMAKGMRPNAGTYTAVFEAFVKEQKVEEAKELLEQMKSKGFVADEKAVKEALNNKRGPAFRGVMEILFGE
ncbi:hypothetical protein Pint_21890 [Pistacia integerrima]|uniref:Uncharacterized protein n=1 Tax=Pistacia integerrima TaxID=434235 RepID=A0ACC0XAB9_9ROSI|nr:hypothetical protein Pint_21890 [Pistacia integerrima]